MLVHFDHSKSAAVILIQNRFDMSQDELHRSDTMQEKLSLVARFGVSIGYYKPSQKEYFNIVTTLAKKSYCRLLYHYTVYTL